MTDTRRSSLRDSPERLVWHVVCDVDLRELLRRAHEGEDPDLLYIEFYANGERDEGD